MWKLAVAGLWLIVLGIVISNASKTAPTPAARRADRRFGKDLVFVGKTLL